MTEPDSPLLKTILILAFLMFAISWGMWKYQYRPNKKDNPVQTAISSQTERKKLSKQQRAEIAGVFEQKIREKGMNAAVTVTDAEASTIHVKSRDIDELIIREVTGNAKARHDLYVMGFTRLTMTDGTTTWNIELKE